MANAIARGGRRSVRPAASGPVIKTTNYDLTSSALIALLIGFITLTAWMVALWLANPPLPPPAEPEPPMLVVGGYEDGAPDETLKVESPEDPTDDPAVEEAPDETQIEEVVENIVELSDKAAQQVPTQTTTDATNSGKVGSKEGSGRRPLGSGGGEGNFTQRWFVRFNDVGSLNEYAKQLDYYGIRIGVKPKGAFRMAVISNFAASRATVRQMTGKELKTLNGKYPLHYFRWAAGGLAKADSRLIKAKAGIDLGTSMLFHFPSIKTVNLLYKLEGDYLDKSKKRTDIRRVYFSVRKKGSGYEMIPTKYLYK